MTGFGAYQMTKRDVKFSIEVKSVNHRYLDLTFSLPLGFGGIEEKIRSLIKKYIQRGSVSVFIRLIKKPLPVIEFNKEIAKRHLHYADQLKKEFGLKNDLTLADLMKFPGVVEMREVIVTPNDMWKDLENALKKSLESLDQMRKREGKSIFNDMNAHLKGMFFEINKIQERYQGIIKDKKKELNGEEFKSFEKSIAINEEISRFKHYIEELKKILKIEDSVGKKIDFVAQEMQRESNTMGSKLMDKTVSSCVVSLKGRIEKIREQAQNIE